MDLYESRAQQLEKMQKMRFDKAQHSEEFWTPEENAVTLQILRLLAVSKTYDPTKLKTETH